MSIAHRPSIAPPAPAAQPDPWRYGWRFVKVPGSREPEQVPLTEEDILHPLEGDFIVNNPAHAEDCRYMVTVLQNRFPDAVVLSDCRIDFNIPGVRPLGPDVALFRGCDEDDLPATFDVAAHTAEPLLAVEITSPESGRNDRIIKRRYYHRAGVPVYVIVDPVDPDGSGIRTGVEITALRRGARGWTKVAPDEQGRVPLAGLDLLLGRRGTLLRLWDARTGEEIGDYSEVATARSAAEARAESERQRAETERQRAEAERQRAEAERQRAEAERQRAESAEARIRELERRSAQRQQ